MDGGAGRAAGDIRAAIVAAGGAIPFSTFVELALYGPHGFYTDPAGGAAGRRGDFLTSPEVGPLFGAVLAARPACSGALRYMAVDVSAAQRRRHPEAVTSLAATPDAPIDGVVVANELLDNLPFRLAVHDGAWREAYVAVAADGSFAEVLSAPFDRLPAVLPRRPPHGARAPLQDAALGWLAAARALVARGSVLVVDYARPSTAELARLPWRSWLRTYRGHDRGRHPLADAGEQDITADVALDQLPEPDAAWSQAQFLQRWGIDDLVAEGRAAWTAAAARPDLAALTMRSRAREAEALLDPAGLGGFTVLAWTA